MKSFVNFLKITLQGWVKGQNKEGGGGRKAMLH